MPLVAGHLHGARSSDHGGTPPGGRRHSVSALSYNGQAGSSGYQGQLAMPLDTCWAGCHVTKGEKCGGIHRDGDTCSLLVSPLGP